MELLLCDTCGSVGYLVPEGARCGRDNGGPVICLGTFVTRADYARRKQTRTGPKTLPKHSPRLKVAKSRTRRKAPRG